MSSSRPTLPRYHLAEPSEDDAVRQLASVLGERRARQVWEGACEALNFERAGEAGLTFPELQRVADYLSMQPTAVGPLGTALRIRLASYEALLWRVSGYYSVPESRP